MVIFTFSLPIRHLIFHPFVFVRDLKNNHLMFLREKNSLNKRENDGEEEREIWMSIEHLTNGAEKRNKGR